MLMLTVVHCILANCQYPSALGIMEGDVVRDGLGRERVRGGSQVRGMRWVWGRRWV